MTKTFCDRCKKEIKGHAVEVDVSFYDRKGNRIAETSGLNELCGKCAELVTDVIDLEKTPQ